MTDIYCMFISLVTFILGYTLGHTTGENKMERHLRKIMSDDEDRNG